MGVVFLAQDTRLCRPVAIKVLHPDRLDEEARRRLHDEALTLSRLSHPNVAAVFDFGSDADIDYLVMEYVPGTMLDVLLQRGPLSPEIVASLGMQLARGLSAAHVTGIVHRDIKPGNLRVTSEGLLKILDFGVATWALPGPQAVTSTGVLERSTVMAGTIQYMAPERLRGTAADPRADIFSAGAVIYEMACGRPPFFDPHPVRLIEAILDGKPRRPSLLNPLIGQGLEDIILRALNPDPDQRFARAIDLADALGAARARKPAGRGVSIGALGRWATRLATALVT
jgi:serine/threonine-protein kinase